MNDLRHQLQGLWLPLVTPFRDGALDELSLRRLVRHYASGPVDGFILGATSGEGLLLTPTSSSISSRPFAPSLPNCRASCRSALALPARAHGNSRRCWI